MFKAPSMNGSPFLQYQKDYAIAKKTPGWTRASTMEVQVERAWLVIPLDGTSLFTFYVLANRVTLESFPSWKWV